MKDFCLTQGNIGQFVNELYKLLTSGGKFRVNIVAWREKRSLSQNSLYWKWLGEIDKQSPLSCGEFKGAELWHEIFKKYYCPVKQITNGTISVSSQSTKLLDVGEMTFYLNKVEQFCIERAIVLTIPEDSEYSQLMRLQSE